MELYVRIQKIQIQVLTILVSPVYHDQVCHVLDVSAAVVVEVDQGTIRLQMDLQL